MEVAFRCAALSHFDAEQNVLTIRGKEDNKKSAKALIRQLNNNHDLLQPDFSTLFLAVKLDYAQFRHTSLLSVESTTRFGQPLPITVVLITYLGVVDRAFI